MGFYQVFDFMSWLNKKPTAMSIVLGVFGVLVIVVGVLGVQSSASDSSQLRELRAGGGVTVRGTLDGAETVIRKKAPGLPDRTSYCPRYAYTASDGVRRTLVDRDDCESSPRALEGRTVSILVDSEDPQIAFIDEHESAVGRTSLIIFAWSMLVLGLGLVTASAVRFARRIGRRSPG